MDLTPFVDGIRRDLTAAADVAGPEAAVVADRLIAGIDAAVRLALLGALSAAADEVTRELAPGAVEVRLRGGDPDFVVLAPPTSEPPESEPEPYDEGAETGTARITLRLPEALKSRVEAAATRDGMSTNTWLVRALTVAVGSGARPQRRGGPGHTFQGWVR